MSEKSVAQIKALIEECSADEQLALLLHLRKRFPHALEKAWGIEADIILNAIVRSSDLTKRGMRGIIAEAVFSEKILDPLVGKGWKAAEILDDRPYDFLIKKGKAEVRIQVKLQRMEKGVPKLRKYGEIEMFIVEVQKTRTGKDSSTKEDTRPYRFGEFDIIAVSMHPSTKDWTKFYFTVGNWLLARAHDEKLMNVMQPVAKAPNDMWTDSLETCITWLRRRAKKRILDVAASRAKTFGSGKAKNAGG